MANPLNSFSFIVFVLNLVFIGFQVSAVPYDSSYTAECLATPLSPQYNGGIVVNPEMNEGLKGWTTFGDVKVAESNDGNKYIVASNTNISSPSFSQTFNLEKEKLYTFSAWLQVSNGSADIAAVFKTPTRNETAGWITAQEGCWTMLKGGLVVNTSGPAEFYFESKNSTVEMWADSISLQPFTQEEWKSHQDESIEKFRKSRVQFQAVDQKGQPVANATVSIKQHKLDFPFGCAMNQFILNHTALQDWFAARFKYTVFENEMKWYANEVTQGDENYTIADAMVNFSNAHGIKIRGHNVLWDSPRTQPTWVPALSTEDLRAAINKRVNSVMNKYKGQLIHWDVVNENMHNSFLEDEFGPNASTDYYKMANSLDGFATPFLNEYHTIEKAENLEASPSKYLQRISQMRAAGYSGPLGIGAQGHFSRANLAYTRSAIDMLASAKLPIWVTEYDVKQVPNQVEYYEQILRELHSHGGVEGIILWSAWNPEGCYMMCLTDNDFKNLATGDIVDKFISELTGDTNGTTDSNGFFETSLFHGEYEAKISGPGGNESCDSKTFDLVSNEKQDKIMYIQFKIDV